MDHPSSQSEKCKSSFLKELSEIADLFVCTAGKQEYCDALIEVIDPDEIYFKRHRVHATNQAPHKYLSKVYEKQLNIQFGSIGNSTK
jgi:hypothetical protein